MSIRQELGQRRDTVRHAARLLADPRKRVEQYGQRVDELLARLVMGLKHPVRRDRALLTSLTGALDHLNPLAILSRGYSVTRKLPAGTLVRDASDVTSGDMLSTKLHKGEVISRAQ